MIALEPDLVDRNHISNNQLNGQFENEQQYNEEGIYCVRFWRNNRSILVIVDDYIPCSQYGKPIFGSFTGSDSRFEIWSMLVEKAFAKLHGGYDAIVGGQEAYCLQDLYGGIPSSFKMQDCQNESSAWDRISQALEIGNLLGACNDTVDTEMPEGLRKAHTYGIIKLAEIEFQGSIVRLVHLRNSWGTVPLVGSAPSNSASG